MAVCVAEDVAVAVDPEQTRAVQTVADIARTRCCHLRTETGVGARSAARTEGHDFPTARNTAVISHGLKYLVIQWESAGVRFAEFS